jgi:hypothetical protein
LEQQKVSVLNLHIQAIFGKLEKYQTGQAHLSAPVFGPPCADCVPGIQTVAAAILPSSPVLAGYKTHVGPRQAPPFFFLRVHTTSISLCPSLDAPH